jgi:outer membrane protein insertion porin family
LQQLLPIYAEGAVDEDLLQEGRRNIRDALQGEGYFDAEVTFTSTEDTTKGERVITYNVNRGDQHKLAGVGFDGNQYFGSKLLAGTPGHTGGIIRESRALQPEDGQR